jgi:hypothetical protein
VVAPAFCAALSGVLCMAVFVGLKENLANDQQDYDVRYGSGFGLIIVAWIGSLCSTIATVLS